MTGPTCAKCRYAVVLNNQIVGQAVLACHFNPPTSIPLLNGNQLTLHAAWPPVTDKDWCSHYKCEKDA